MQREQLITNFDEDDCPHKTHEKDFTCEECGVTFHNPILATISASGQTKTYYACPRCMTKVPSFDATQKEKKEGNATRTLKQNEQTAEPHDSVKCQHFFGYLNKHRRDTPFPEECLTCAKMVECLLH